MGIDILFNRYIFFLPKLLHYNTNKNYCVTNFCIYPHCQKNNIDI